MNINIKVVVGFDVLSAKKKKKTNNNKKIKKIVKLIIFSIVD